MTLPFFDAIIFDMDGLVLDTESTYAAAWKQAGLAFEVDLDDAFLEGLFGRHAGEVAQLMAHKLGPGFALEAFHGVAARLWHERVEQHGIGKMPGVDELLEDLLLAEVPYVLATNSDAPYAERCLQAAGVTDRFPERICRDQVAYGKPEPDLILAAAQRLRTDPSRCLVLEDSETGLQAACRAGALPVLVANRATDAARSLAIAAFPSLIEFRARLRGG
jgi:beta-phosphoglucomutase